MQQLMYAYQLELIEQQTLQVLWASPWYQEDIEALSQQLFGQLSIKRTLEHNSGADRESIRFYWQKAELVLNFDYYSQSCWFEGASQQDLVYLPYLQAQLQTVSNK